MTEPKPEEQFGAGDPDQFQRLWTPHRMAYIKGESKPTGSGPATAARSARSRRWTTTRASIVRRGDLAYVVLNLYPYNSGHLMVCPYRHVADYTELDAAETRGGRAAHQGRPRARCARRAARTASTSA